MLSIKKIIKLPILARDKGLRRRRPHFHEIYVRVNSEIVSYLIFLRNVKIYLFLNINIYIEAYEGVENSW